MRMLWKLILVLLLLWAAWSACAYQVDESRFAILQRFGDPRQVIDEAGLYFKLPPPLEQVQWVDRRVHLLDPEATENLTADKKNVLVNSFAIWTVADARKFWVSVGNKEGAEARLSDLMRSEVRSELGQVLFSALVSHEAQGQTLVEVAKGVTDRVAARAFENYGIELRAIRIKRLSFPMQNKRSVFQRMQSERERIAKLFRSEGEEEAEKIRAAADREKEEILSKARRTAEGLRGKADAEAMRIYAQAFGEDPELFELLRSLEAYPNIIKEDSVIVVDSDSPIMRALQQPPEPRAAERPGEED
jgi:membrane protease subunit HflC